MKLFISWSGQLSREVGETLRKYLPLMLQGLNVFMSKNDLESGARWSLELAKELDESQFGLICLTPDNLNSSWILFEAGALTKHFEGRACGLLLNGLKPIDINGPLAQFQHKVFEKNDFFALLKDINAKTLNPLSENQLDMVFEKWWTDLEHDYKVAVKKIQDSHLEINKRDSQEVLEEILVRIREISQHLDLQTIRMGIYGEKKEYSEQNVAEFINTALNMLPESSLNMLLDIVDNGIDSPFILSDLMTNYSNDDLQALQSTGFVEVKDEKVIVHHRVFQYLRTRSLKWRTFMRKRVISK